MGMSFGEYASETLQPTFFQSVVEQKGVKPVFSICMTPRSGGAMVLGGVGPYHIGEMRYVPLVPQAAMAIPRASGKATVVQGAYILRNSKITVAGHDVPIGISRCQSVSDEFAALFS